jgi:hypothetical protein
MTVPRINLSSGDRVAVAIASVSAGTLLIELSLPHALEAPASIAAPPAELVASVGDIAQVGPVSDYFSVTERPLFSQDRRPFVPEPEPAPVVPAGPRVEFELTAVIITSATQIALLRSSVTPTVQRVTLNESVDGWTLAEVTPNNVVLRRGAESVTVPLRPDAGEPRSGHAARIDPRVRGD